MLIASHATFLFAPSSGWKFIGTLFQECSMNAHEKRQLAQSAAVVVGVDAG